MSVSWLGFDLDDTLHPFTRTSQRAMAGVFAHLQNQRPSLTLDGLSARYQSVCKELVTAFTDGRTAHLYRLDRMQALLKRSGRSVGLADELVDLYVQGLAASLTLEEGALAVLHALKEEGLKIAVVTEGPHDAQA